MTAPYALYYWPIPFRGQIIRVILAHAGVDWREADWEEVGALKGQAVGNLPYPFMAPPLLEDREAGRWISQLPAITMYLGRKHGLSRVPDTELRLVCDASDILVEVTRGHGAQMWDRAAWDDFVAIRLPRWMALHERLVIDEALDAGEIDLSQLILTGLWHNMVRCLPGLRPVLAAHAPTVAALVDRVAQTPRVAALFAAWDDGPARYCAGEIEASILDMLEGKEDL